MKFSDFRKF